MFRAGFMQYRPRLGEIDANLVQALEALENVEADLIVLPELAFTGYALDGREEARTLAEYPRESKITAELSALALRKDMHIATGFAELDGEKVYNSALLIGPRGILATYRKLHLFNTEKECFDPGDLPLEVCEVKGVRIGMMVCFDWIFPEVSRALALLGADLICHPSNLVIPEKCQYSMITRCIENRVYAVTANRYGSERGIDFTGESQIVAPGGELIHRAEPSGDEIFIADIDPELARDKNITPRNNLFADRRADFYYQKLHRLNEITRSDPEAPSEDPFFACIGLRKS